MPVKTTFPITFTCGHTEDKDLSHKPAHERAGFAAWLAANGTCTDCWRQQQGLPPRDEWVADTDQWKAQQRQKRSVAAAEWAQRAEMPELSAASDKQRDFAAATRFELLGELYTHCVENDDLDLYERAESIARTLDSARWWLDQRDQALGDPQALIELLRSAADAGEGTDCENTY